MDKLVITFLHYLFVLVLYAGSGINLIMSVPNKDTYNLAMAILLYIIAIKHERLLSEESEVEDGNNNQHN